MEKKQTIEFMDRIKSHYQEFIIDDFKIKEWHEELKDYNYDDVNKKLDEHLKNEQYGNFIPKVYFLTKYLTKESQKGQNNADKIYTNCQICGKKLLLSEYDKHFDKCSSIEYLIRQAKKQKEKLITREELEQLSDERFNSLYEKVLDLVLQNGSKEEKYYITQYRNAENCDLFDNSNVSLKSNMEDVLE